MKIHITARKPPAPIEFADVVLDTDQIYSIVLQALQNVYDIPNGAIIINDDLIAPDYTAYKDVDFNPSRPPMRIIRKATDRDATALRAIADLTIWRRNKYAETDGNDVS